MNVHEVVVHQTCRHTGRFPHSSSVNVSWAGWHRLGRWCAVKHDLQQGDQQVENLYSLHPLQASNTPTWWSMTWWRQQHLTSWKEGRKTDKGGRWPAERERLTLTWHGSQQCVHLKGEQILVKRGWIVLLHWIHSPGTLLFLATLHTYTHILKTHRGVHMNAHKHTYTSLQAHELHENIAAQTSSIIDKSNLCLPTDTYGHQIMITANMSIRSLETQLLFLGFKGGPVLKRHGYSQGSHYNPFTYG